MVEDTERLLRDVAAGQVRDVHADMMRLTLEIVVKTLLDADGDRRRGGRRRPSGRAARAAGR